ncbi:peptide chain release factor 2 [bacterium]|nr:MAG: peptide chain release factor 2 [bacterium]
MISIRELKESLIKLKDNIHQTMDYLKLKEAEKEIKELDRKIQDKDVWQENFSKAEEIQSRLNFLKNQKQEWAHLEKEVDEFFLLIKDLRAGDNKETQELLIEIEREYENALKVYKKLELEVYLGKKYDRRDALLLIYSGAGGIDAQNWAKMLLRMYERYAEKEGLKTQLFDITETEENGIKNAVLKIKGNYAYGMLKNEAGVHRLIRISPYSSQSLRHTSFVLVEVLPEIAKIDLENYKIDPKDLRVDLFKSSGPGGQNVNRRETAVRITHIPTGLHAASQKERSQSRNREEAMKLLLAKVINALEQKNLNKVEALKEKIPPEWGHQIRTYVLHPYKQVRDHRTKLELSNVDKVLDGDLGQLIEANLRKVL